MAPLDHPALALLAPLGSLYERLARARRQRYASGRSPRERLPHPVVSIGNITVGGTGKTPLTILLASRLAAEGRSVSVLSRGYGGRRAADPMIVDPDTRGAWREVGDEPLLIARSVPEALVTVGRRRIEAGRLAERTRAVDVHILDDGFQHLALARDLDVVLVGATLDPRRARCLPAGPYREPPAALRFADVVIVKQDAGGEADRDAARIASLAPGASPLLAARLVPRRLAPIAEGPARDPSWLQGRTVGAFAAIGEPASFRATLESLGARVCAFEALADHAHLPEGRIARIVAAARAHGAEAVVCTAKDAVRIAPEARDLPLLALEVELQVDRVELLLERVRAAIAPPGASTRA